MVEAHLQHRKSSKIRHLNKTSLPMSPWLLVVGFKLFMASRFCKRRCYGLVLVRSLGCLYASIRQTLWLQSFRFRLSEECSEQLRLMSSSVMVGSFGRCFRRLKVKTDNWWEFCQKNLREESWNEDATTTNSVVLVQHRSEFEKLNDRPRL